jgi:hypothetical protein
MNEKKKTFALFGIMIVKRTKHVRIRKTGGKRDETKREMNDVIQEQNRNTGKKKKKKKMHAQVRKKRM